MKRMYNQPRFEVIDFQTNQLMDTPVVSPGVSHEETETGTGIE